MTTSVLIVEDEPEFMRRFSNAVLADPGLTLVGAVSTGRAAQAMLDAQPCDVMLLDLGLPDLNGVEVIRYAAKNHPRCDVLVVTMFGDDQHVLASIEAGATGYLLKDAAASEIVDQVRVLRAGGSPISAVIARQLLLRFAAAPGLASGVTPGPARQDAEGHARAGALSPREREVLLLCAKGYSYEEIGPLLDVSHHTVTTFVKRIYRKLQVHSKTEAVYEARRMGFLDE